MFAVYRERLKRVVRLRLSRPLQGRLNESDVVQEVFDDAARRLIEYLQGPALPFFLWLRQMACQKLVELHRRLLGNDDPRTRGRGRVDAARRGAAGRECGIAGSPAPGHEARIPVG